MIKVRGGRHRPLALARQCHDSDDLGNMLDLQGSRNYRRPTGLDQRVLTCQQPRICGCAFIEPLPCFVLSESKQGTMGNEGLPGGHSNNGHEPGPARPYTIIQEYESLRVGKRTPTVPPTLTAMIALGAAMTSLSALKLHNFGERRITTDAFNQDTLSLLQAHDAFRDRLRVFLSRTARSMTYWQNRASSVWFLMFS